MKGSRRPARARGIPPRSLRRAYARAAGAQAGISTADRVVTVSPGYAWEIQTPEGGWGMEGLLGGRAYALNGVLNGIDGTEWSPESDPHLPRRYGRSNFSRGKAECKAALQAELGLPLRPEARRAAPPRPCCASSAGGLQLPRQLSCDGGHGPDPVPWSHARPRTLRSEDGTCASGRGGDMAAAASERRGACKAALPGWPPGRCARSGSLVLGRA